MKVLLSNKKMVLKKSIYFVLFFLVSLFLLNSDVNAANFKYSEFDFDKFAEKNLGYWTSSCAEEDTETEQNSCKEKIITSQKKFYTRLYKLLAKYSARNLIIDDKVIIETVFFELNPSMFNDSNEEYKNLMQDDLSTSYNTEDDDLDTYSLDSDDYGSLEKETDTLKVLIKNMIGYPYTCKGYIKATATVDDKGTQDTSDDTTSYSCSESNSTLNGDHCEVDVDKGTVGFWEYITNATHLTFFRIKSEKREKCIDLTSVSPYYSYSFDVSGQQVVDENRYWEFLLNGDYFDRKKHLQHYFTDVLTKTNHQKMLELSDSEYADNIDAIKKDRQEIITKIKQLLENYGEEESVENYSEASSNAVWWPIGSTETTEKDGVTFASGNPVSTGVSSKFGMRILEGKQNYHGGIDLTAPGEVGTVNVIAAKDGVVVAVNNNCLSYGDRSCGGMYGNYVKLSHSDGTYTLYAHLHQNTITVKIGDAVKQGQVIGKMGSSGNSTGMHLHFEVWSDATTRVDPEGYIDSSNPRPVSSLSSSSLATFLINLEGGPTSGTNYKVICNSGDIPTVGHGITLLYNVALFAKHGINLKTSNNYYNYCGTQMPISVCDAIYADLLNSYSNDIKIDISNHGLSLAQNQIDALVSLKYNHGNINGFYEAYNKYKSTDALCTNWWNTYVTMGGLLTTRRQKECNLFVHGTY